jgi:hypothetical protein
VRLLQLSNRLAKEEAKNSGGTMQWKREDTYDAAGNRTEIDKDDGSGTTTYDYTYNHLMQLTKVEWPKSSVGYRNQYTYDDNGNLASKTEETDDGGWRTDVSWTYSWDVQDRLTKVEKSCPHLPPGND